MYSTVSPEMVTTSASTLGVAAVTVRSGSNILRGERAEAAALATGMKPVVGSSGARSDASGPGPRLGDVVERAALPLQAIDSDRDRGETPTPERDFEKVYPGIRDEIFAAHRLESLRHDVTAALNEALSSGEADSASPLAMKKQADSLERQQ